MITLLHLLRAVIAGGVIGVMLVALALLVTWGIPSQMLAIRQNGTDTWPGER